MIARVADGLPLCASIQEDEQTGRNLVEHQNQAKMLFRKINEQSPVRCSIETGPYIFHYLMDSGVCYLVLCEKTFSRRTAFAFLEDIQTEFYSQYGQRVGVVARPYSFIEFDTYIQKAKKSFTDSRSRRNLGTINNELQDVQRIMVQNIDDVLQRGEALSALDDKAGNLVTMSQQYKKDARYLNLRSSYAKIGAIIVIIVIFLLLVRYFIF